jgi:hypothetical protein
VIEVEMAEQHQIDVVDAEPQRGEEEMGRRAGIDEDALVEHGRGVAPVAAEGVPAAQDGEPDGHLRPSHDGDRRHGRDGVGGAASVVGAKCTLRRRLRHFG